MQRNDDSPIQPRRYKVGIDVGTNSVGLAAIDIDDDDNPVGLLNCETFTHDGGVDPSKRQEAITRKATSGVARRTRRLIKRRTERLRALDEWIEEQGWPIVDLQTLDDPYAPWKVRAQLAAGPKLSPVEFGEMFSMSLRHMARHRGWRSPYSKIESLFRPADHSDQYLALRDLVEEKTSYLAPDDATPAELLVESGVLGNEKLRGPSGLLGGKLMQSDNANELRMIAETQDLDDDLVKDAIRHVFAAKSPVGSATALTGKDSLPGQTSKPRASRASLAFQEFRIVAVLTNLRVQEDRSLRNLSSDELNSAAAFLMSDTAATQETGWDDVAKTLGLERGQLKGTAELGPEGERVSARPPINDVANRVLNSGVGALKNWWKSASVPEKSAMTRYLDNVSAECVDEESEVSVNDLVSSLSEEDLEKLDKIAMPSGRSPYSEDSLTRLTKTMLANRVDLHQARKQEFGVDDSWTPPAEPIGAPVGNPAVDRVLKIVARWLEAAERRWGPPVSVNIEHVRAGFTSEAVARDIDRDQNRRAAQNQKTFQTMQEQLGISSANSRSDLRRYLAIQRQHCACAYCGDTITFTSAEMDHIVPRSGPGSTNTRNNLVAVCRRCNHSKADIPFATWAASSQIAGVSLADATERVYSWLPDPSQNAREAKRFRSEVIARLKQTDADDPIDARSMESVAWMARELSHRIDSHFSAAGAVTETGVYRGSVTAEARKASGVEKKIQLIGGPGKSRLDRRHHAVDAVVIALMRPSVAKTLAQRTSMRQSEWDTREPNNWREYTGEEVGDRVLFNQWRQQMELVVELVNDALENDAIPVLTNTRLRLGNGRAHEDTVRGLTKKRLAEAFTAGEIDRASSPALWCALTRLPDFDTRKGLPPNPDREISVNGKLFSGTDEIGLFGSGAASIAVRGGYCELGDSVHHARIYRIPGKAKPTYAMLRVFSHDLLRHQREDLFSVPLAPQSVSVRGATLTLKKALASGDAEYIGWLVRGDEIRLDSSYLEGALPEEFWEAYPESHSWRVDGFADSGRLRLRPVLLAAEGLPEDSSEATRVIVERTGWRASVTAVFSCPRVNILRRNALGEARYGSGSGLPVSWRVENGI